MNKSFSDMQRDTANTQFRATLSSINNADLARDLNNSRTVSDVSEAVRRASDRENANRLIYGGV